MKKQSKNRSTRSERKRLVLQRDTVRTLLSGLPRVAGGKTGDGDNNACTGNETGCRPVQPIPCRTSVNG